MLAIDKKHMEPSAKEIVLALMSKYGLLGGYVLVGVIGIFGLDILSGRTPSKRYVFGTACAALFIGYLASNWCMSHFPERSGFLVPVATLFARDIMLMSKMIDRKKLFKILTGQALK